MKTNAFGEQQAEPGDDITAMFEEVHGDQNGLEALRSEFGHEEHLGGWTVEVRNRNGDGILARGFETPDALVTYLQKHHVTIA